MKEKTKILILVANSKNTSRERFGQQVREIEDALLQRAKNRNQFKLISKWAVRPRDIQRAVLDNNPQIVHFLGRAAGFQEQELENDSERKLVPLSENVTESEGLVFEDETGQGKLVSGEALAGLFGLFADTLECVVINNCYSKEQAEEIAKYIPYVIGTKQAISNQAAIEFAVGFYDALGDNRSIVFAYNFARSAIQIAGIPEHLNLVLVPGKEPPIVPDPNKDHFQDVLRAITRGKIVPFLGPAINLCDRQEIFSPSDWQAEGSYPPSRSELAVYLEKEIFGTSLRKIQCPLCDSEGENLPEGCPIKDNISFPRLLFDHVSELSELRFGGGELKDALKTIVTHPYEPNELHQFFAKLPRTLRKKSYETPILIVTANFDSTLELAFKNEKQPFDLVSYVDSKKCFLHQKFRKDDQDREEIVSQDAKLIIDPNNYRELDFDAYPVILKLYGLVNGADYQEENFVITEDHFIDYLAQRPIAQILPQSIFTILRRNHIWFLGYGLSNWDERVALHRIWANEQEHNRRWWAIQEKPKALDKDLWEKNRVTLITMSLENYIAKLNQLVEKLLPN